MLNETDNYSCPTWKITVFPTAGQLIGARNICLFLEATGNRVGGVNTVRDGGRWSKEQLCCCLLLPASIGMGSLREIQINEPITVHLLSKESLPASYRSLSVSRPCTPSLTHFNSLMHSHTPEVRPQSRNHTMLISTLFQ